MLVAIVFIRGGWLGAPIFNVKSRAGMTAESDRKHAPPASAYGLLAPHGNMPRMRGYDAILTGGVMRIFQ